MKENYFTPETIQKESAAMLADIHRLAPPKNPGIVPGALALLVLDMQRFFLDKESHAFIPSAPAIIPNIMKLKQAFVKHKMPVIFTRHIDTPEDGGLMNSWWRDLIRPESPLSPLIDDFNTEAGDIIEKSRYDAFLYTDLEERLNHLGVKQLVITGVMTHLCCESTARSAFMRGFNVFFTVDGCATYNRQFHRAALLNLAHGFALPMQTGKLLEEVHE